MLCSSTETCALVCFTVLFLVSRIYSDVVIAQAPSYIGTAVCNTIVAGRTNYAFTAQRTQPSLTDFFFFSSTAACMHNKLGQLIHHSCLH
jgi:hypothetical protein